MCQVVAEVAEEVEVEDIDVFHIHLPDHIQDHVQDQEVMIDMNHLTVEINHFLLLHIDLHVIDLTQEVAVDKQFLTTNLVSILAPIIQLNSIIICMLQSL
jgi:hypothetical protein